MSNLAIACAILENPNSTDQDIFNAFFQTNRAPLVAQKTNVRKQFLRDLPVKHMMNPVKQPRSVANWNTQQNLPVKNSQNHFSNYGLPRKSIYVQEGQRRTFEHAGYHQAQNFPQVYRKFQANNSDQDQRKKRSMNPPVHGQYFYTQSDLANKGFTDRVTPTAESVFQNVIGPMERKQQQMHTQVQRKPQTRYNPYYNRR